MKNYTLLLMILISISSFAQDVNILDNEVQYKKNMVSALTIYLKPDTKEVKKELKDFLKDQYDVKLRGIGFLTNKDVLYAKGADFKAISNKKLDFYAKVVEENDQTQLSFFANDDSGTKISPSGDNQAYYNMQRVMSAFLNDYLPGYYKEQVEDAAEEVEDLNKKKEDLTENIKDNNEDISKKLKEIEELRSENESLEEELEKTYAKLKISTKDLDAIKQELEKLNTELKRLLDDNL